MEKKTLYLVLAFVAVVLFSCKNNNETGRLENENDSIENVNSQQRLVLSELTSTLVEVSTSLDSIAAQEGLLKREVGEGGKALTKQQVIENLNAFKAMLAQNRAKLKDMEQKLSKRDDQIRKLTAVIKHLNNELDEKEATIKRLYDIISQKDANISDLKKEIETRDQSIVSLKDESASKQKIIDEQAESFNTVYYLMGSKADLKAKGLLQGGGFLSKKKLNTSNLDKSHFNKASKNSLTHISIPSKSAKVLTNMPADSYTITKNSNKSCTLEITSPDKFWNYTKFLIIETK